MNAKPFTPEDYEMVSGWWKAHGWDPMPLEYLPEGIVVDEKAAGFLYKIEGKPGGILDFCVANPANTPRESYKAVSLVVKTLIERGNEQGMIMIQGFIRGPGMVGIYERCGFTIGNVLTEAVIGLGA